MDADDDDLSSRPCPSNKCTMFTLFLTPRLIVIAFKLLLKTSVMRGTIFLAVQGGAGAPAPTCRNARGRKRSDKCERNGPVEKHRRLSIKNL